MLKTALDVRGSGTNVLAWVQHTLLNVVVIPI